MLTKSEIFSIGVFYSVERHDIIYTKLLYHSKIRKSTNHGYRMEVSMGDTKYTF